MIMPASTLVFEVLAEPRRREIIEALADGEQSVSAIVARVPIAQSGVSRHLRILDDAGFVAVRSDGQRRLYSLRPEPFSELDDWLAAYRTLWEGRLDALARELERRRHPSSQDMEEQR